jgi:hypothetical protein
MRRLRATRGLSQEALAHECGMGRIDLSGVVAHCGAAWGSKGVMEGRALRPQDGPTTPRYATNDRGDFLIAAAKGTTP